jgi:hypothetical protein
MKKPSRDGEFIPLVYDADQSEFPQYVRGHIDGAKAAEIMELETDRQYDPESATHVWARCQTPSEFCPDGCSWEFRELAAQERGAFRVTRLMPLGSQP